MAIRRGTLHRFTAVIVYGRHMALLIRSTGNRRAASFRRVANAIERLEPQPATVAVTNGGRGGARA